ncbi:MAG: DMT family transporter [Paracoccaceae bacterium]|nr:DMT family transporter [Paracoccaceae bacterium]
MINLRGILFMILSMACFAVEDTFIKLLSARLPATQILFSVGFGGALITLALAVTLNVNLADKILLNKHVISRTIADLFGAFFFTSAMVLIPMSLLASILQATPLFVTLGAAILLGEKVGWRRWSAIFIGFLGIIIILQPGYGSFQMASLLGLAAVLCLALRDVVTRDMATEIPTLTVTFYACLAMGSAGFIAYPFFGTPIMPTTFEAILLVCAAIIGVTGYFLIVLATRKGDVSVIAPFRYSRLLFSLVLASLILGEMLTLPILLGGLLVVSSGIYTFGRERRLVKIQKSLNQKK